MSTAGKVLSVLVTLVAFLWILLASSVTQLNRNGTQALEALKKQVAKLETDVIATNRAFVELSEQIDQQQRNTQTALTVLQTKQSGVEAKRAEYLEIASRVRLQVADVDSMLKAATTHSEQRLTEKDAETKGLADPQAAVETLKGQNSELLARLSSLREKFASTLKKNKSLIEQLLKSPAPAAVPAALTRPAILSR